METIHDIPVFVRRYRWSIAVLAILNGLDFFLTWALLTLGHAFEANPVAAQILGVCGWWGMAALKASSLGLVLAIALCINRRRDRVVGRLLRSACAIMAAVVGYSVLLLNQAHGRDTAELHEQERGSDLEQQFVETRRYMKTIYDSAEEIVRGRLSLTEAVDKVSRAAPLRHRDPLAQMSAQLAALPPEVRIATHLMNNAGYLLRNQSFQNLRTFQRLYREFIINYGQPVDFAMQWFPRRRTGLPLPPEIHELAPPRARQS